MIGSHLIKDLFFKNHNWPLFTDPIAIAFGVILLLNDNVLQQFIGIFNEILAIYRYMFFET
tara:strand:+ start:188 stop:370 length:183 start_codon:yes stop_codon:yes gene_type:complete